MTITLQAKKRDTNLSVHTMRVAGDIPAVAYGAGKENIVLAFAYKDFVKVFHEAGESSLITLAIEGKNYPVLVQEIQRDPVTDRVAHVDLKIVDTTHKVTVSVPITFEDDAPAAKEGGTVGRVMHEIEVEALPQDLPHTVIVSLAALTTLDSQIHAKDIALPSGVTLVTDAEAVVAMIARQVEEVEEPTGPIDFSAIEVEKKGKKEEETETTA